MNFFERVVGYITSGIIIKGALITIQLTLLSEITGVVIGFILAVSKTSRWRPLRLLAEGYIWLFRGTPVLLQMIFVFAALPQFGLRFSPFVSAFIALSLNEGAYMAEIVRAGLQSVGKGQWEAAHALGMRNWQVMRYIVLPQALRVVIPPTANQFIGMLKTSALASVVAVQDLLLTSQRIASANFDYVATLTTAAAYYLFFTTVFTYFQNRIEKSMQIEGRETSKKEFKQAKSEA